MRQYPQTGLPSPPFLFIVACSPLGLNYASLSAILFLSILPPTPFPYTFMFSHFLFLFVLPATRVPFLNIFIFSSFVFCSSPSLISFLPVLAFSPSPSQHFLPLSLSSSPFASFTSSPSVRYSLSIVYVHWLSYCLIRLKWTSPTPLSFSFRSVLSIPTLGASKQVYILQRWG